MPRRHPRLPVLWLMTDERIDRLLMVVRRLPPGAGIVFRHHATPGAERRAMFKKLVHIAHGKKLLLLRAGDEPMRGEAGVHGAARRRRGGIRTWAVHSRAEALAGRRAGADLLFVSPVFSTRSHPGEAASGVRAAARIVRGLGIPAVALGGMDAKRFRRLSALGFHGWAGIDALTADRPIRQKRKAVPI